MKELEKYVTLRELKNDEISLIYFDFNGDNPSANTKNGTLTQTDRSKVNELLVSNILKLSKEKEELSKLPFTKQLINHASNFIAVDGKIGQATNMLISEDNYTKYGIDKFDLKLEVMFDDSVEDCILYRKNTKDQPGLILLYNENKYEFMPIGFFPEKQFSKIKLS